ncbi:hypothetical protein BC835DRAFT_1380252 [Cytidiella melzeri]|nr:hypothetical protein BC835DRAFT_1380252 [Cytidiella melzeri]
MLAGGGCEIVLKQVQWRRVAGEPSDTRHATTQFGGFESTACYADPVPSAPSNVFAASGRDVSDGAPSDPFANVGSTSNYNANAAKDKRGHPAVHPRTPTVAENVESATNDITTESVSNPLRTRESRLSSRAGTFDSTEKAYFGILWGGATAMVGAAAWYLWHLHQKGQAGVANKDGSGGPSPMPSQ